MDNREIRFTQIAAAMHPEGYEYLYGLRGDGTVWCYAGMKGWQPLTMKIDPAVKSA